MWLCRDGVVRVYSDQIISKTKGPSPSAEGTHPVLGSSSFRSIIVFCGSSFIIMVMMMTDDDDDDANADRR